MQKSELVEKGLIFTSWELASNAIKQTSII